MSPPSGASRAWDVVGVGANAVDRVYVLPSSLAGARPDAKLRIEHHVRSCGGQTATMLATCRRLGARAAYIGTIGSNDDGALARAELTRCGIDLTYVVTRDAPNPYAVILIDASSGERMVLWDRDERLRLEPHEVPADVIGRARLVHVDDVDLEAALAAAQAARRAGVPVTSDIERAAERVDELIAAVTCPIFAEPALADLTGLADPERALRRIRRLHPGLLCVTLGSRGAMGLDGDRVIHAPSFEVRAVDTTGAGDVFRGAFAMAWLEERAAADILRFANAAAAVSCTKVGAMAGAPTRAEIDALLRA